MGTDPLALAQQYREKSRHRGTAPAPLIEALAMRYRTRRRRRIEDFIASVKALPKKGPAPDARSGEALEYTTSAPDRHRDTDALRRWRATTFDLYARDILNTGERVGGLRLRPGQHAVLVPGDEGDAALGVTALATAPWTDQQQRALDDLARLRELAVAGDRNPAVAPPVPGADDWRDLLVQFAARRTWRAPIGMK